jgi:XTP/dITP diphosphohydrolase
VAEDSQKVKQNWEQIKLKEKGTKKNGVLDGVPKGLTGIVKAYRMQEKASQVGFDWDKPEDAYHKIEEEWNELKEAQTAVHKEEEFGDYLFALINWGRLSGINADDALERTNQKFYIRFRKMEELAEIEGKSVSELSFDEQEALYQRAKQELKHS